MSEPLPKPRLVKRGNGWVCGVARCNGCLLIEYAGGPTASWAYEVWKMIAQGGGFARLPVPPAVYCGQAGRLRV